MKSINKKIMKMVLCALFAALTFCATFVVKIPTATGGYVHLGDGMVLLSAWVLGPVFGTLAAGIGSMLSDLLGGYPQYILPTFVIKSLMALVAYAVNRSLSVKKASMWKRAVAAVCGGVVMVIGYYFVEAVFLYYGFMGALASVIPNILQATVGAVVAILIYGILLQSKRIDRFINE